MKNKLNITMLFLLFGILIQAQNSINTSSQNIINSSGSTSYSFGQLITLSLVNNDGSISHGVQQAYEIVTLSVKETNLDFILQIYPNPTTDKLILKTKKIDFTGVHFILYDITGKIIKEKSILNEITEINMSPFISSSYFLKLFKKQKEIKTIIIIKN